MVLVDALGAEIKPLLGPFWPRYEHLANFPPGTNPPGVETIDLDGAVRAVRRAKPLPRMPLAVISKTEPFPVPPGPSAAVLRALNKAWPIMQNRLASLEPQTPHILATGIDHNVQVHAPDLTTTVIRLIWDRARNQARLSHHRVDSCRTCHLDPSGRSMRRTTDSRRRPDPHERVSGGPARLAQPSVCGAQDRNHEWAAAGVPDPAALLSVADAAPADAAVTPTIAIACEPDRQQLTPADGARCRYAAEVTVRRTLLLPMRGSQTAASETAASTNHQARHWLARPALWFCSRRRPTEAAAPTSCLLRRRTSSLARDQAAAGGVPNRQRSESPSLREVA
jgi:hypothetical protein